MPVVRCPLSDFNRSTIQTPGNSQRASEKNNLTIWLIFFTFVNHLVKNAEKDKRQEYGRADPGSGQAGICA
jgi:hypothetical protein